MGRTKCSSAGDMFSFPVIIQQQHDSDDFEFGSMTSPTCPNSTADHLFSNGKLLPHAFPIIQTPNNFSYSRSTSRTSSKQDSLMSSRSTSTNSRSSTSTSSSASARTSTSEASERRLCSPDYGTAAGGRKERIARSCQYQYGSSRRWQLIAAVPVLKHQESKSRKIDRKGSMKSRADEDRKKSSKKSWCGRDFFKSFVSACQECHAIKT